MIAAKRPSFPKQVYIEENGYSSPVAELTEMTDINWNAVQDRIGALARKGLIIRAAGTGRTIRPVA